MLPRIFQSKQMRGFITQGLEFSWDYMASLFWARYPNPYALHVLHEDVLERILVNDHTLYTKRILVKKGFGQIPFWLRRFLSNHQEVVLEESLIDLEKKEIITSTRNFGSLAKYAVLVEDCLYTTSSENRNVTEINRKIALHSNLGTAVVYPLWSFLSRRYVSSAEKSLHGYRFVCQQFAGELGYNPNWKLSSTKLAYRLKEFALKKRPLMQRAQAVCENPGQF